MDKNLIFIVVILLSLFLVVIFSIKELTLKKPENKIIIELKYPDVAKDYFEKHVITCINIETKEKNDTIRKDSKQ